MPWPLPALLAWAGAWLVFVGLQRSAPSLAPLWAVLLACSVGVAASLWARTWWRRSAIALGFPLSLVLTGAAALPAWAWLAPLALLLLVYPINAWRDAPVFPTPRQALDALAGRAPLPAKSRILDAGCGMGDGLRALRRAYFAETIADEADMPEVTSQKLDKSAAIRACMNRLTADHRDVIDLVYYHEKSVEEVAEIVGIPENTVKTRLFYARKKLAELLKAAGIERGWP